MNNEKYRATQILRMSRLHRLTLMAIEAGIAEDVPPVLMLRSGGRYRFQVPKRLAFLDEFKSTVLPRYRDYDADAQTWSVAVVALEATAELIKKHFGAGVEFEDNPLAKAAQAGTW